jgi:hypothetical protein
VGGRLEGVARQAPAHAREELPIVGASSVIAVNGVRTGSRSSEARPCQEVTSTIIR